MIIKRLQTIWTQAREIRLVVTNHTIRYIIPLNQDEPFVKNPKVVIKDGFLEVIVNREIKPETNSSQTNP